MSSPPPLPSALDSSGGVSVGPAAATSSYGRYELAGTNQFGLSLRVTADTPPPLPFFFSAATETAVPGLPSSPPSVPSSFLPSTPPAPPVRPARPAVTSLSPLLPQPASASASSPFPPPFPPSAVSFSVPVLPARPTGATHRVTASSGAVLAGHHTGHSPLHTALSSLPPHTQPRRASADKRSLPAASPLSLHSFPLPRQLYATMTDAGIPRLSDEAEARTQQSRSATETHAADDSSGAFSSPAPSSAATSAALESSSPAAPPAASTSSARPVSPYSSLPSLFPSSSRVRVACELADTERTYVSSLRVLVRLFIEPLSKAAATDKRNKAPLSSEQVNVLFSNAKLIFSLNESFHHSLSARLTSWLASDEESHKVGDVIAQFAPYFKLYSQYCSTYDASQRLLTELTQSNAAFQSYVSRIVRKSGHKFQSLGSLLIQPIQR